MVGSIALLLVGLGAFCALMYYCAVFALPVAIGLWTWYWAMNTGAGIGGVALGFIAGVMVFVLGQLAFAASRSLLFRWIVLLLFTVPAVVASYSMALQFSEFGVPSPMWRHVFAVVGAIAVGCTVLARFGIAPATGQPAYRPR